MKLIDSLCELYRSLGEYNIDDKRRIKVLVSELSQVIRGWAPDEGQPVAEGPTDEELRDMADFDCDFDRYDTTDSDGREGVSWECSDKNLVEYARAVLAKYGTPTPQPPADGEVGELVKWLRIHVSLLDSGDFPASAAKIARAADLLQHPQPVAVSERPWERKGWCDEQGMCWAGTRASVDATGDRDVDLPPSWELREVCAQDDVCLPANALPLPSIEEGK